MGPATRVASAPVVTPPVRQSDVYEEEEPARRRTGLIVGITALILLVLGIGAFAAYQVLTPNKTAATTVAVPNVLDYREDKATEQLTAAGLRTEVAHTNGPADSKGTITAQDPVGGTQVDPNSAVTITVNDGPKTAVVPDGLVGEDLDKVQRELDKAGFTNVKTAAAKTEDPDTKEDEVVRVSPGEGSTAELDAKITVTYATGKSVVPDFTGFNKTAATQTAKAAGFGTPKFIEQVSDSKPEGTVIAQTPAPDQKADRNTRITLTLATAPAPTPTPTPTPPSASPLEPSSSPS